MIRVADIRALAQLSASDEAAIRILGAATAYGTERAFCRFWTDENGGALMIAEGVATLHCSSSVDEWAVFLAMSPDVHTVRTDGETARTLAALWGIEASCGCVMRGDNVVLHGEAAEVPPAKLYPLIREVFGNAVPPFDGWYADVHHRMRRGRFRASAVCEGERVCSCAMTVAECDTAVLLGAVATDPAFRGRGFASACVTALTWEYQQNNKEVYISPKNDAAAALYSRLGFVTCGEWGIVVR